MLGLVLKDLYSLKRYAKFLLVYAVIFGLLFSQDGQAAMSVGMITVLAVTLSISSFSYDEYAKWDRYAACLPLSRKKVVMAKYILVLALMGMGMLFSLAFLLVYRLFVPGANLSEGLLAIGATAAVGSTMVSLIIPFIYKFGAEKSRMALLIVFAVPTLLVVLATKLLPNPGEEALERMITTGVMALPFLCIAIIAFSYVASVKIYSKKEIE